MVLSLHGLFERTAGAEARRLAGSDLDLLAGLRVDALAGLPLAHLEGAEASQRHLLAAGKGLADHIQCILHNQLRLFLAHAGLLRHGLDELRFLHPDPPMRSNAVTADGVGFRSGSNHGQTLSVRRRDGADEGRGGQQLQPNNSLFQERAHWPQRLRGQHRYGWLFCSWHRGLP